MSYTVDANVLLYASDAGSAFHERAAALVEKMARGPEIAYLFWPTAMSYLRIASHPSIFTRPLTHEEAAANIEALLARPHIQSPGEQPSFWDVFRRVSSDARPVGNLVRDAHLVALMRENGVREIWTHDRDYRRFRDITVRDPFETDER